MLRNTPLFAESWNVAFRKKSSGEILDDTHTPFAVIKNNFRYWAADPFVVEKNGKTYIFAELYDYVLRRGVLGCCTIDGDTASKWVPIIKEPYHLSYPCVIERDGKDYLMPESGEGECLSVYEAVEFPYEWKKAELIRREVKFADTTPIPNDVGNLALTHNVEDPENPFLAVIDMDGNLQDIAVEGKAALRSRPAGHIFFKNGEMIRPAQISENTAEGYGKGLVFCKCTMDEFGWHEEEIKEIYPGKLKYTGKIYLDGMHTYNANDSYEVIDIKTRRFNILNFVMRIAGKLLRR